MSRKPAETTQKPKLSRTILEDQGIFFDEKVCNGDSLDEWICPIREQLIRLRRQLPEDARKKFTKELKTFRRSGQDSKDAVEKGWSLEPLENQAESVYFDKWCGQDPSVKKIEVEIDACMRVAILARQWRKRNEMEPRWQAFLQKHIFKAFHDVQKNSNCHADTLVRWELHENLYWNEFLEWTNMNPSVRQVTGPKPDFTYAFPIIDTTKKENLSYLCDSRVESFSLKVLGELRIKNKVHLKSAPTTTLHKLARGEYVSPRATDLICFPWAIVEVKKNKENLMSGAEYIKQNRRFASQNRASEEFCYCQAANASAAALTLRENLTAVAKDPSELRDALVIFSFTCVGPTVKLWVTYRRKLRKNNNQKEPIFMVCIWATSLELTWGVIALRMVIKNMHVWVNEYVKPEISRWIRMVHKQPSPQSFLTPSGVEFVRARRAASCEPQSERPDFALLGSQYRTPRSKAPPTLSRGRTAPDSVDRQRFKACPPDLQLNGCVRQELHDRGSEEDNEETGSESEADEGYASHHTHEHQREEEEEDSSTESDSSEEQEIKSLRGSRSLCAQSSEEDDYREDESWEEEDDESSDEEDQISEEGDRSSEEENKRNEGEDQSTEEEEDNGGEEYKDNEVGKGHYVGTQRHLALRLKTKTNCSPAKDCKSKNKSRKDQSPRLRLRRRSSHI